MWFVVAGLMAVAIAFMAKKSGTVQTGTSVGPDTQIAATGTDAVQSPATTGGNNTMTASRGKLIVGTTSGLARTARGAWQRSFVPPPATEEQTSGDLDKMLSTDKPQTGIFTGSTTGGGRNYGKL